VALLLFGSTSLEAALLLWMWPLLHTQGFLNQIPLPQI
jgi:hypothetical protein